MKTYQFTIVETRKCYYEVEAESLEQAKQIAQNDYDTDQVFLEIDDSAIVEGQHFLRLAQDVVRG